ncbi:MAG: extracellular solute-binding protein [Candidatus Hydrogenedentes bacterium]|nr:extracellular solute-binding protein [Candidatus Hydrogenedentota bacterium]
MTLYYWGWETDVLGLDQIEEFQRLHDGSDGKPAIKVIMGQSAVQTKDGDFQRLLCSVVGGDPPDVVIYGRNSVAAWASRGAFLSLQPFLERDWAERPDDPLTPRRETFYPHCWTEASYDGQLYALPSDTEARLLFYNLDVFDKHAADLIAIGCVDPKDPTKPGPPRTWDQLRECTRLLSEYDDSGKLTRVGYIPNYGNTWLCLYSWLNGAEFLSPDGRTSTMNSPEVVDALTYMTELYDIMGGVEKVRAFESSMTRGDLDPFLTGKIAMKIDGDGFLGFLSSSRRDMRFGVAMPPAPPGKPQISWAGGWCWVIPTMSKHPDEAWEFVKFLSGKRAFQIRNDGRAQSIRAGGHLFIPTVSARKDLTEWGMDHYVFSNPGIEERYKEALRVCVKALPLCRIRPLSPVGQLWWNEHVRAMEGGLYKRYDPADVRHNAQMALDVGNAVVQKELDRIYGPKTGVPLDWRAIVAVYLVVVAAGAIGLHRYFNKKVVARGYFRHEFHAGYLFASPWFLGFVVFGGGPILFSLLMSFCDYDAFTPPRFVGMKNYVEMFTDDPLFYKSLGNTAYMTLGIPLSMAAGLAIAMLLNYSVRGMAVYRTFYYLPSIMPAVAGAILWMWIFNPQQGLLNTLIGKLGIPGPFWLQSETWSKPALIVMGLWGAGGGMIIWLAGLKGIPAHLYEAAILDGAGRFRCFRHVTLPMLSPYIFFNLIMGVIGTFQIFTQAYIMTQGGPVDSTMFYAYALFNYAFKYMRMGYASAMAWVLCAIVLALTVMQLRLSKRWVHYESEE